MTWIRSVSQYVTTARGEDGSAEYAFGDPEFNIRQLRSNVVLRWEYMPGSRAFPVWSQDRSGFAPDATSSC